MKKIIKKPKIKYLKKKKELKSVKFKSNVKK